MYGLLCADPVKAMGENMGMQSAAKHTLYCELVQQLLTELDMGKCRERNAGQNHNLTANKSLRFAAQFRHLGTTLTNGKLHT